jgi:hypothetical protein
MALTLDGTNGIVSSGSITTQSATGVIFSDSSSLPAASSPYVLKNRIINGAMVIDQRNAGASVTITNTSTTTYTLDRWAVYGSQASKFSVQQDAAAVTPPVGFNDYLGVTSLSAYSIGSGDIYIIGQKIEGYNIADFAWGTANAKTITLSFWVRSSLTGTFGGTLSNNAFDRSYPFTYTISAANTWEQKTLTIAGDTTGTWLTTNGTGLTLWLGLGCGSSVSGTAGSWQAAGYYSATGAVSVVGTNGATFYITGVQLEQNTSATPFERRLYGMEFDLCRRYAEVYSGGSNEEGTIPQYFAQVDSANRPEIMITYYLKRASPTFTLSGNFAWNSAANTAIAATYLAAYVGTFTRGSNLFFSTASGVAANSLSGIGCISFGASGGGKIIIDAEL